MLLISSYYWQRAFILRFLCNNQKRETLRLIVSSQYELNHGERRLMNRRKEPKCSYGHMSSHRLLANPPSSLLYGPPSSAHVPAHAATSKGVGLGGAPPTWHPGSARLEGLPSFLQRGQVRGINRRPPQTPPHQSQGQGAALPHVETVCTHERAFALRQTMSGRHWPPHTGCPAVRNVPYLHCGTWPPLSSMRLLSV